MIPLLLAISLSSGPGDWAATAADAYRAGLDARGDATQARPHFVRSAAAYEQLWSDGTRTPAVAANMAQARLLAGDLGRAIRDYRRGLRRDPHHPDLLVGLRYAREQVAFPLDGDLATRARATQVGSRFERLGLSWTGLVWTALGLAAAGWLLLARAWVRAHAGQAAAGAVLLLTAAGLGYALRAEDARLRAGWAEPTAVLIVPTDLRTGNSDEYPRRIDTRLPAGVEVRILGDRGGWLHVELADGTAGWLPRPRTAVVD